MKRMWLAKPLAASRRALPAWRASGGGAERGVDESGEGKEDVVRGDRLAIVPGRPFAKGEPPGRRIDPIPARGQPRAEGGRVTRNPASLEISQLLEDEVGDVAADRLLHLGPRLGAEHHRHRLRLVTGGLSLVQLLDVGWDAEPPYYVMEFIEHGSLNDLLQSRMTVSAPEAVVFFREIAIGLAHAHGKGVLHCDLKPANILLDSDLHPRLADFGQSRLSHEQTPALGTLFYMAPEQAAGEETVDERADVFALGGGRCLPER